MTYERRTFERFERNRPTNGPGIRNSNAKLINAQVRAIMKSEDSAIQLAEDYDLSVGHVRDIRAGRCWSHLAHDDDYDDDDDDDEDDIEDVYDYFTRH